MLDARHIVSRLPRPATHWGRRLGLAVLVGIVAGCAAAALHFAIQKGSEHLVGRFAHLGSAQFLRMEWGILLLPAAGGLLAGAVAHFLGGGTAGHGVDLLTRAFHHNLGKMGLRSPSVKTAGTALVISCGGSAGPEGPTAALGAALGSAVGRLFLVTPRERRLLLVAGCSAGIGAIFRCPLGGALFGTSILYREPEFESEALVSSFVASVIGYSTYMLVYGVEGPFVEGITAFQFESPADLLWYAVLGPLCGLTAILFFYCLRLVEHGLVPRSRLPRWLLPGLGGLATGAVACLLPQVMDGRFLFIQNAIDGTLFDPGASTVTWSEWALLFALIAVAKCLATGLTVGSGAPGGVLGPSVFIGGTVGAFLGALGHALFPHAFPEELRRALIAVGMAGVLAATMRVPLAAIVMTTEMTGSYGLIAPLMLVCVTSYVVGRRFGLNDEQLRTAADSPAHAADPIIHLLESWRVKELMRSPWPLTVTPDAGIDDLIRRLEPGTRPVVAVAHDGRLAGLIAAPDLARVMDTPDAAPLLVASDVMSRDLVTLSPDEDAYSALSTFARADHEVLPVLTAGRDRRWVGMLERRDVVRRLHEQLGESHLSAFDEHAGLRAIRRDLQIDQLLMGVPSKHAIVQRLLVPIDAIGRSLRECAFRRRYGAEVIGIEQRDGSIQCPPDLDAPLRTDQRLLAVVWDQPAADPLDARNGLED